MKNGTTTTSFLQIQSGKLLSTGIFAGGILLYFHAPLLTALGWEGGFQFVTRVGTLYLAVGTGVFYVRWVRKSLDFRNAVLTTAISLPIVFAAIIAQPSGVLFTKVENFLLYGPMTLTLPLSVAYATSRQTAAYALVGCVSLAWAVLVGLVLQLSPRGPIGIYLLWNYGVVIAFATPLWLVGWTMAKFESA